MIARLESGEVLLTTSIAEVSFEVVNGVLARDAALGEFNPQGIAVQFRQARRMPKGKPAAGVVAAGQLNLHVPLPFAGAQGQSGQHRLVEFQRHAHDRSMALFLAHVKGPPPFVVQRQRADWRTSPRRRIRPQTKNRKRKQLQSTMTDRTEPEGGEGNGVKSIPSTAIAVQFMRGAQNVIGQFTCISRDSRAVWPGAG